jgi:hypothetical protein
MRHTLSIVCCLTTLAASPALRADTNSPAPFLLNPPASESPNRLGAAFRMGLNLNVTFKGLGSFAKASNPGPATGGAINRTYDDGYNWVDISGNNHGAGFENTTWNWGVANVASQITPSPNAPQAVAMHSLSSSGTSAEYNDDPQIGFELTYNRELLRRDNWRGGLEAAFGYTDIELYDNRPLGFGINQLTDTYTVPASSSGQPLPSSGSYAGSYAGTVGGSNPVIGSIPSRVGSTLQGLIRGSRRFDADLYTLRFGPYVEVPVSEKVSVALSGGFALAYVRSDLDLRETVSVPGRSLSTLDDSSSHDDFLPGVYVAGTVSVSIAQDWAIFASAQFEDVGSYKHRSRVTGQEAVMDLSESVFVTLGISYSF